MSRGTRSCSLSNASRGGGTGNGGQGLIGARGAKEQSDRRQASGDRRQEAGQLLLPVALIHVPLDEQPPLLGRIGRWLRPGGWFLAATGHRAWTGIEDQWLGGDAPMWWSHADAATYRAWIEQAGLPVVAREIVPEGDGAHALFWARRPLDLPG